MCGIAGIYLRDLDLKVDLDSMLNTMLDKIEHRGGDATGFLAMGKEGVLEWCRAACDVPDFKKYRRPVPEGTRTILAHTRYATQGLPGFIENNHPIRRGAFYVIHNGHVSNDQQLFKLADRQPYGQVDSEAIPARLASIGSLAEADIAMEEIEGAAAIAAVDENNPGELLLAKGYSSPLFVLVTNKIVLFGSTYNTVEKAYRKHIGRLPRKRRIENLLPGELIHFAIDGKQTRRYFESYSPKWTPNKQWTSTAWKETTEPAGTDHEDAACSVPSTRHLPTVGGWPKWDGDEDYLVTDEGTLVRCDVCGDMASLSNMEWEVDDEEQSWAVCPRCQMDIGEDYSDVGLVSAAVLGDEDDEDDE